MARKPDKRRKKTVRGASKKRPPRRPVRPTWDDDIFEEESYGDETYDEFAEESYARSYEEPRGRRRQPRPSDPPRDDEFFYDDFSDENDSFYLDEQDDLDRFDDRDYMDEREPRAPRDDRRNARERDRNVRGKDKRRKKPRDNKSRSTNTRNRNTRSANARGGRKPAPSREPKPSKPPKKEKPRKPMSPTRRRIIRIVSYVSIVAVVLVVGVILSLTVLFKTQAYEVSGNTRYTNDEIIDACGIDIGDNIFLAPKHPAEKRIKDTFPYIEDVSVNFKIPDTIRIAVEEAVDGYLVKLSDSEYLVISTKGRILNRISDPSEYDLPIFIGPTLTSGEIGDYVSYEDDKVVSMIESITQTFADNGYQGITEIDATNMADISFTYDNRIKVKLGIPEDLDYKIRTAMIIINDKIDSNTAVKSSGVLDVSRCNTTKRSYFDEIAPTVDPSEAATESSTESSGSGSTDTGNSGGADIGSGSTDTGNSGGDSYYVPEENYSYYDYGSGYAAGDPYVDYGAVEW